MFPITLLSQERPPAPEVVQRRWAGYRQGQPLNLEELELKSNKNSMASCSEMRKLFELMSEESDLRQSCLRADKSDPACRELGKILHYVQKPKNKFEAVLGAIYGINPKDNDALLVLTGKIISLFAEIRCLTPTEADKEAELLYGTLVKLFRK